MAHVLVVEVDNFLAAIITDVLVEAGHRVEVTGNSCDVLEWLRADWPDVIILDLVLPVVSGWEFIERYRSVSEGKAIPAIALSDPTSRPESADLLNVRRFITKPFDVDDFVQAVGEVLAAGRW